MLNARSKLQFILFRDSFTYQHQGKGITPALPPSFSTPGFAAALLLPQKSPQRWREHPFPSLFPPFSNRVRVPYGRFLLAPLEAIHKRRQQSGEEGAGQVLTQGCVNLVSLEGVQNPQILTDVICERHFLSLSWLIMCGILP